jgi:hypothetical protein
MVHSPLWAYVGKLPAVFKCPADKSAVVVNGVGMARVRSYSMSQVFGNGEWLGVPFGNPNPWRVYAKAGEIVVPAKTFLFLDEHPDSMNDGSFGVECTRNQPGDAPGSAFIVDFPASFHEGAGCFSFADGRSEEHRWVGATIKPPLAYTGTLVLAVPAGDSWVDAHWLAANTTVSK